MAKKLKRARNERRKKRREAAKDMRAREKLSLLARGGSPGRAIEVSTPAVIATMVRSMRCHQCAGELEPANITAESTTAGLLRVARTRCRRCHVDCNIWFAIGPTVN